MTSYLSLHIIGPRWQKRDRRLLAISAAVLNQRPNEMWPTMASSGGTFTGRCRLAAAPGGEAAIVARLA